MRRPARWVTSVALVALGSGCARAKLTDFTAMDLPSAAASAPPSATPSASTTPRASAVKRLELPPRATTPAGPSTRLAREPVRSVVLGANGGCAEVNAAGQRQHWCWTTGAERPIRARRELNPKPSVSSTQSPAPRPERARREDQSFPSRLVASDTFTCAVADHFVECWGKSRDGFFRSPGPSRIPGLRFNGVGALSAGPRGLCGDGFGDVAYCVGAVGPAPRGVTGIAVSPGDDANACGIGRDGVVCWGEAYSPPGRPRAPVLIQFEREVRSDAPVVDSGSSSGWDSGCRIHRPCARDWSKPPRCGSMPAAVPWASALPDAGVPGGVAVSVSGKLFAGPVGMTGGACFHGDLLTGVPAEPNTTACCNDAWAPIVLVSGDVPLRLEGLACRGDDSRSCCNVVAEGQSVVATGTLVWIDEHDEPAWMLRDPVLCALD